MNLWLRPKRIEIPVKAGANLRSLLTQPFLLLAGAIVVLALGGIRYTFHEQKDKEVARLQAIIDLKVRQVTAWLGERHGDAQLLHGSRFLADRYQRWRDIGDPASRAQLLQRLDEYRQAYGYQSVLLLDDHGELALAATDTPLRITPELRATIQRAIIEGRVLNTGLHRGADGSAAIYLDFVAPLRATAGQAGPAVVLRVDPAQVLYPMIQFWPFPSASAETELFRRDGDQVVFLNGLRHRPDAALELRLPVAEKHRLAIQLLEGDAASGSVVEGVDYRRTPALGVGKAVPGTDWFLLAKLDRSEIYAPAIRDATWIALVSVITLLIAAVATLLIHQRQRQVEQLHALQLLANERHRLRTLILTIPDLVWLKDPDGVYLACNRTFERFFGAREADIIGKTDYDFVAAELADFFRQKDREALAADESRANEEWITFADDGHRALLQTLKTPMRDAEGHLVGVLGIGRDITAIHQAEAARKQVERQYRMLFREMLDGFALHDLILDARGQPVDYRFLAVNPAFERLTGLKAEALMGRTVLEVLPGTERYWIDTYGRVALTGEPALFENYSQDLGRYFKVTAFRPAPGQFACIFSDITEHRRTEIALRAALDEKIALLKEIHHRVKNNLQIITSLLNLQARQVQSPTALAALQDTQGRIRSMALLHESLYLKGHLGWVDGAAYLTQLCAYLSGSFGLMTSGRVRLHHDLMPVALTFDQAVPCGLIVNELVSNAFKHAFPGERGGEIRVELHAETDGCLALAVIDDGVGLPPGLDLGHSDTLGLQLVVGLAQQLGATIGTQTDAGTRFQLTFPAHLPSSEPPP